ncbi:MAG: sigma-54-dependent Fis family transcriptional regulator [Vicinamibacteria bacterium]|nr:sigma-54-dependent Fis family transcriptional regulator [Vicinamibacteria bacterium]
MADGRPRRGQVLVVDDETYVRNSLGEMLASRGFDVDLADGVESALRRCERRSFDVVLTDLKMPEGGGLELVRRVRASYPEVPVVVLTGFGTVSSAVECLHAGASDYVLKPAAPSALELVLDRAMESRAIRRELEYLRGREDGAEFPVGRSDAWRQVLKTIQSVAPTDSTVLILGESGTGKELLARLVHRWSARSRAPYVRVSCAAVPVEMWESEFFGHRKGAFTGAVADREGHFRLAHRGTLFMDEVGSMPLIAQAKILRVVQDGEFNRLGDERATSVDVRLMAATNSDLEKDVAEGRFRQDLFYRLNVIRIVVPPLRERIDDIPLLAAHFAAKVSARLGRSTPAFSRSCLEEMTAYSWPGNVRELGNAIERTIIMSIGDIVESLDLAPGSVAPARGKNAEDSPMNLRQALLQREKEVVLAALGGSGGVRKEAARLLGIDQRNLGYYLRKHGIDADKLTASDPS